MMRHQDALTSLPAAAPYEFEARLRQMPSLTGDPKADLAASRAFVEAVHRAGGSGHTVVRLQSAATDRVVGMLWARAVAEAAREHRESPLALVALGGYGRRELAPYSDVDLLVLHPDGEPDAFARAVTERLLLALWDLRLEVGHALRDRRGCEALAETDHSAHTALLDLRRIAGDPALHAALESDQIYGRSEAKDDAFIADKLAELRARRERFGDSLYLLEPNVKQSEGGLRDLQTALWLARVRFGVSGISELLTRALLPERDLRELRRARDFLWRARNALHFLAGRKNDHLTFDVQPLVAHAMGFGDPEKSATAEAFMRHYYLAARTVLVACDAIVDRCLEPRGLATRAHPGDRALPGGELEVFRGRLRVADRDVLRSPAALVRLFATADREGLDLDPETRDLASEAAERLSPAAAADPEVNQELLALLSRTGTRGRLLGPMHDLGVLPKVLPELARITARRQIDVYHVYTVDVHSLFALRRLYALRCGDLEVPVLSELARGMARPLPLYLGTLFHDIGKGAGADHSARGAEIAAGACVRLGLDPGDAADVEWLVLKHLRMSAIAQRRDLSDPHLIHQFAEEVGTVDRLEKLYLLTFADVSTVGPHTWTEWKGQLLRELYEKTRAVLAAGERRPAPGTAESAGRAAVAAALAAGPRRAAQEEIERFLAAMPPRYFTTAAPARAPRHLRLLRLSARGPLAAFVQQDAARGAVELTLSAPDRPGLLAVVAGVLAAHRIDIHAAEVFSTPDDPALGELAGRALDVFLLRGPDGGALEPARWRQARGDLVRVLAGEQKLDALLARRQRAAPPYLRPLPRVATKVVIDNESSRTHSVVDVFTADRVGLLHTLARTFFELGLGVDLARISTEGHRAADAFYVRCEGGRLEGEHARRVADAIAAALEA